MIEQASIPGYLTTAQAARVSGLTAHRIGCLVRSGDIDAIKSGNTLLVNAASLNRYAQANQGRGRPMDAQTAFGALWLLSGLDASWLPYARKRRLRLGLQTLTPEKLSWQLRKRSEVRRYRAGDSFLEALAGQLVLSGSSSAMLGQLGLLGQEGKVEGYCLAGELNDIEDSYFLRSNSDGNVVIRVAQWLPEDARGEMPIAVVAVDLTQSLDTRVRGAGMSTLGRLLDEYRSI